MNRRDFLKLFAASTAAAIVVPPRLVTAKPGAPERLITEYSFAASEPGIMGVSGFILDAPAGQNCRARFLAKENAFIQFEQIATVNGPAEILMEQVLRSDMPMMRCEIDVSAFSDGCPVDWGALSKEHPIDIDYRSLSGKDEKMFIALWSRSFLMSC